MSGLTDTAKNLTGSVGQAAEGATGAAGSVAGAAQSTAGGAVGSATQQQQQHTGDPAAPRSLAGTAASESNPDDEGGSPGEGEGEMVPAAGRINDEGEVIDDDGNAIGRVVGGGDGRSFAGFIVTQEGDVLDEDGGVVAKAEPLDDVASDLNYTTTNAGQEAAGAAGKAQSSRGGFGSALGGFASSAQSALGGVTGLVGRTGKTATGAVGDTAQGATGAVGQATGAEGVADTVGGAAKGATDAVGDTTEGATGAVGDTAEGATGAVGETVEGATGAVEDTAEGATGAVGEAAQGATDTAQDATKPVTDAAEGEAALNAEGLQKGVQDTAEGAQDAAEGAVGDAQDAEAPISMKDMAAEGDQLPLGSKAGLGSKVGDLAEQQPAVPEIEIPELSPSVANKVIGLFEGPFTVADGGKVADKDGRVLGRLADDSDLQDLVGKEVKGIDGEGNLVGEDDEIVGRVDIAPEGSIADKIKEQVPEAAGRLDALEKAQQAAAAAAPPSIQIPSFAPSVANKVIAMFESPFNIGEDGQVTDKNGRVLGRLAEGQELENLVGKDIKGIDGQGNLLGDNETVLGKVDLVPEGTVVDRIRDEVPEAGDRLDALDKAKQLEEEAAAAAPIDVPSFPTSVADQVIGMFEGPFNIAENGQVTDHNGRILGKLAEGQEAGSLVGKDIKAVDAKGNLLGDNDTVLGKIDLLPEGSIVERIKEEVPRAGERLDALDAVKAQAEGQVEGEEEGLQLPDISILEGLKINKQGNVVDENGNPLGKVKSGDLKKLVGKTPDKFGKVWDDKGNVLGEVEVLPEAVKNEASPFEDFPGAIVDKFGKVIYDGRQVGVVVGDDFQKLIGKEVDADGDILDKNGNVIGHAERKEEEEPEEPEEEAVDYSMLRDKKVNKAGNVVDDKGQVWGHVVQGILKHLVGKKVGDNGEIFNDAGQVIGKAEPIPDSEREEVREPAPFEDYPGAVVADAGKVMFNGEQVGIVVEGDAKKLKGKTVDADGDILDRAGNQLGRAERWEEPEAEPEPEVDMSALAGKRINKAGNAVDKHGDIYGRVVEGDIGRLVGKMCDKNGCIRNEGGDIIGRAELIPEAEREGMKEGPFTELPGCTVNKEGKVVTPGGDVVGRLTSGDPHVLFGRVVDDDGDILDKNGNVLGTAERWEEPEEPKEVNPMSGRKVNREGNVVDENGDLMGKLTTGELSQCAGKKIDDDGDVVDQKGNRLGHCSLLEEIPPTPEPEETEEEKQARLQLEQDKKIANQISYCIEQSLDKIKPLLRMITGKIEAEERKPEEERDEEQLVKEVKPLIEEGGKILTEANGVIRGCDPDGRIAMQAKQKSAAREATPEEYRLAELLKELTGEVTETIENAKRTLENLPNAKDKINPLWGLLAEPLFQIIAAVGLLLSGVLGLVGKLLNGLGLGGLVNNLLGGLGLNKVLGNLGLGGIFGKEDKKKKSGGGFLGIF